MNCSFGHVLDLYLVGLGWFGIARIGICTFSLLFTHLFLLVFTCFYFLLSSPPSPFFLLFTKTIISNPPLPVKEQNKKLVFT